MVLRCSSSLPRLSPQSNFWHRADISRWGDTSVFAVWPLEDTGTILSRTQQISGACYSTSARFQTRWRGRRNEDTAKQQALLQSDSSNSLRHSKAKPVVPRSEATIYELEDELLHATLGRQGATTIQAINHQLLNVRKVKRNQLHYAALLLQEQSSEHGSSRRIGELLQEMDRDGVQMNESTATAALHALVVHPDLAIMLDILHRSSQQWIKPTRRMQNFIAAIYIRLHQFELAMQWLEQIESRAPGTAPSADAGDADLWLYVVFLAEIMQSAAGEELFMSICYRLHDSPTIPARQMDVPFAVWNEALSWAVANKYIFAIKWIWHNFVAREYIQPESLVLAQLLEVAYAKEEYKLASTCEALIKRRGEDVRSRPEIHAASASKHQDRRESSEQAIPQRIHVAAHQRLDPWAMLTKDMDPGAAQPRIRRERLLKAQADAELAAAHRASVAGKRSTQVKNASHDTIGGLAKLNIAAMYEPLTQGQEPRKDLTCVTEDLARVLSQGDRSREDESVTREVLHTIVRSFEQSSTLDHTESRASSVDEDQRDSSVAFRNPFFSGQMSGKDE